MVRFYLERGLLCLLLELNNLVIPRKDPRLRLNTLARLVRKYSENQNQKKLMGDLTANFSSHEFRCACCETSNMDIEFVDRLQFVRDVIGKSLKINSGFRCFSHNRAVGGADNSSHLTGVAADIRCTTSADRMVLLNVLPDYFNRIGIASRFIHVDIDTSKASDVLWVYPHRK